MRGDAFLAVTGPVPAEVLVIEAWIGIEPIKAAAKEFREGGYEFLVATGDVTDDRWSTEHWPYPDLAARVLLEAGVPEEKIILASAGEVKKHRTFAAAAAALKALSDQGIMPEAINVFTIGPHARRSRLVFAKTFGSTTKVGSIAWTKPRDRHLRWWESSSMAREMIVESIGYFYEVLLDSGRDSNGA
jgi:uncharacterized SAM-binding protein YcdF (DUF218 family)